MATPILITPPALEPVTLAEARLHLRISDDDTSYDSRILTMIEAARHAAEHELHRKIMAQTWDFFYDCFPPNGAAINVHGDLAPLDSVTRISYLDTTGSVRTVPSSGYVSDPYSLPGYIFPAAGVNWPADVADSANAVRIRIVCGEWSVASDVPAAIRQWMLMQVGTMFRNAESIASGQPVAALPGNFVDRLLDPYRVWTL